ncbi:MAG: signal peptidase I [Actinobacteria bacterium]|nr:signal peptidase I [Actinomycetota bacterium]
MTPLAGDAAPPGDDSSAVPQPPQRSRLRRVTSSTWFHLLLAVVVTGLVLSFIAKPYVVPSGSMQQTLEIGDRVLVNRLAYNWADPGRGDIVVFDADESWGVSSTQDPPWKAALRWIGEVTGFGPSGPHTLVKRIVATPGQKVECCTADGRLIVDGVPVDEPYVYQDIPFQPGSLDCTTTPRSARCFPAVTVPAASYLVLGDHRSISSDGAYQCRTPHAEAPGCFRWARRDEIVGRVVATLWPVSRWRGF